MIRLDNINKYFFKNKKNQIHVINDTSLELPEKGLITILGPSGSGKTTLLNVIGGLDTFDSGTLTIDDLRLNKNSYKKIERIRNTEIGYVFQDYKLIDDMSVFDNVALSLKMCGIKDKKEITARVNEILERVGIYRYRNRKAAMLSGGERQRISIARALVKDPRIVICDEPTGNLDSKKTVEIMNIIKAISKNRLVILVSHEEDIAKFYSDRIIEIKDGKITANYENDTSDELDYEIGSRIYLKDIKNHYSVKSDGIELDLYDNEDQDIKIKLVIRNNSIFIETDNVNNVELINSNSSFELIDEHKKAIDKKELEEQEFNISEIKNKRRTSIYNVFTMIKAGWNNLMNSRRIEKLTLVFAAVSAAFVLYAISLYLGATEIHKEDYMRIDDSYVQMNLNFTGDYETYKMLTKRDDVLDIQLQDYIIQVSVPVGLYYQAQSASNTYYDNSKSSINTITKDDIIYGTLATKDDEVVLDYNFFNAISSELRVGGLVDVQDLVGKKLEDFQSKKKFTITGIVDKKTNTIYFTNNALDQLQFENRFSNYSKELKIYEFNKDNIVITSGNAPSTFNSILLPNYLSLEYEIGSEYEYLQEKYTVSGFYGDELEIPEKGKLPSYVSRETMMSFQIKVTDTLYVAVKDKEAFIAEFGNDYRIKDIADLNYKEYELMRKDKIVSTAITSASFVIITLVLVILMMRASFLSRIKEVGVYRAVGVSKADIYRMFAGESLVITGIGALVGIMGMYYILSLLNNASYFQYGIFLNPIVAILVYVLVTLFYLLIVQIPVFFVLRKSPAAILSRKDV